MSKKLTNKEVLDLLARLEQFVSVSPNLDCFTLYYAIGKNIKKLLSEKKAIYSSIKWHEKTDDYNKKRAEAINGFKKTEETEDIKNVQMDILKEIDEMYKETIEFNENAWKSISDMESDFEVYYIKKDKCIDSKGNPINLNWNMTLMVSDIIVD